MGRIPVAAVEDTVEEAVSDDEAADLTAMPHKNPAYLAAVEEMREHDRRVAEGLEPPSEAIDVGELIARLRAVAAKPRATPWLPP